MQLVNDLFTEQAAHVLGGSGPNGLVRLTIVVSSGDGEQQIAAALGRPSDRMEERAPGVFDVRTTVAAVEELVQSPSHLALVDYGGRVFGKCPAKRGAQAAVRVPIEKPLDDAQRTALSAIGLPTEADTGGAVSGPVDADRIASLVLVGLRVEITG